MNTHCKKSVHIKCIRNGMQSYLILIVFYVLIAFGEHRTHSNAIGLQCGNRGSLRIEPTVSSLHEFSPRSKRFVNQNAVSQNRENCIEILVAVDDTMRKHHGFDLNRYVLSQMSVASKVFQHPSIGHSIKLSVIQIIPFTEDLGVQTISAEAESGLDAHQFLKRFCDRMESKKFDATLLLTRYIHSQWKTKHFFYLLPK